MQNVAWKGPLGAGMRLRTNDEKGDVSLGDEGVGYGAESELAELAAAVGAHDDAGAAREQKLFANDLAGCADTDGSGAVDALGFDARDSVSKGASDILDKARGVVAAGLHQLEGSSVDGRDGVHEGDGSAVSCGLRDGVWDEPVEVGEIGGDQKTVGN